MADSTSGLSSPRQDRRLAPQSKGNRIQKEGVHYFVSDVSCPQLFDRPHLRTERAGTLPYQATTSFACLPSRTPGSSTLLIALRESRLCHLLLNIRLCFLPVTADYHSRCYGPDSTSSSHKKHYLWKIKCRTLQ